MPQRPYSADVRDDEFQTPKPSGSNWQTRENGVEVAINYNGVFVRNSNDSAHVTVRFTHEEWRAFVDVVKIGKFDIKGGQILHRNVGGALHQLIGPTLCACGATIPPGEDICPVGQVQV